MRHDAERYRPPIPPEVCREMKVPSNYTNQLRQKVAYVAWSACAFFQTCVLVVISLSRVLLRCFEVHSSNGSIYESN
jgi:hypothetical protein